MIDPLKEKLYPAVEVPPLLHKLGVRGEDGGPVSISQVYRWFQQDLEFLVVGRQMYTSAESISRWCQARTQRRLQGRKARAESTAELDAVAANERLRQFVFNRRKTAGEAGGESK